MLRCNPKTYTDKTYRHIIVGYLEFQKHYEKYFIASHNCDFTRRQDSQIKQL